MWDFEKGEILAFDKPLRWTSFDLVAKVRYNLCRKLGTKKLKVGHSGTLDPLATGVVIVCTGKKTKLIEQLQYDVKEYVATLQLGATTPSYDLEKEIDATYPTEHITRELIDRTIPEFLGEQMQVPPIFSAVQVNGKRAYDFARKGETVELKSKLLKIDHATDHPRRMLERHVYPCFSPRHWRKAGIRRSSDRPAAHPRRQHPSGGLHDDRSIFGRTE